MAYVRGFEYIATVGDIAQHVAAVGIGGSGFDHCRVLAAQQSQRGADKCIAIGVGHDTGDIVGQGI